MSFKNDISFRKRIAIQTNETKNNKNPSKYFHTTRVTPNEYLSKIRLTTLPEHYKEAISDIEKHPIFNGYLLGNTIKKQAKDLKSSSLVFIDVESEFYWAKNIILKNQEKINQFLKLSEHYSNNLITGNLVEAGSVLNQIESEFGFSLWLIKNKISYLQLAEGLEAQKNYANAIKNEFQNGSLLKFVTHWTSVRNEPQISVQKFLNQVEPIINKLNPITQIGLKEYCRYHLLAIDSTNLNDFIHVLRLEYDCSLIDYYEAFVAILRVILIGDSEMSRAKLLFLLSNDNFVIKDPRLDVLYELLGLRKNNDDKVKFIEPFNMIVGGKHNESLQLTNNYLINFPTNPIFILAAALANSATDVSQNVGAKKTISTSESPTKKSLIADIIWNASQIIRNGVVKSAKEYGELNKISLNFSTFPWATAINIIINKESNIFSNPEAIQALQAIKVGCIHPIFIENFISSGLYPQYEKICLENYNDNTFNGYCLSLLSNSNHLINNLSLEYNNLLYGLIAYNVKDFDSAVKYGEELIKSKEQFFARRGYGLISHSYVNELKFSEACSIMAKCYVNERDHSYLPLKEVFEIIEPGTNEWYSVNNKIDLSIILDAYVKHISKALEVERRFAYEDFLNTNGLSKPSELQGCLKNFDSIKIIYYLRFLCVENIMDTSGAFEGGSKEVLEERLLICRLLITVDPDNEPIYKQEINEIVRKQVITSRRLEIDQSRIYIDIESVKAWAETEVRESFDRYQAYIKTGIEYKSNDLRDISKKNNQNINLDQSDISVPENEVAALLRFMVEEIMEAYLSPEFGLDRFLSTRIRHGILEGHIRKPMQSHNLITKKSSKSGPYLPNLYWLNKLKTNSSLLAKQYDKAFAKFSDSFDKLIQRIINQWLQVKKKPNQKGLFNFIVDDSAIDNIALLIEEETTCKNFIEIVISALESTLILNLINVRKDLNNIAKSDAKKLLTELQTSTFVSGNAIAIELQGEINQARTDLQIQFEKIIDWFVPPASGNSTPYVIEDAIMVADAIIKETNSDFKTDILTMEEESISIHGQLPIFVDIFVNIFENVVKHSGLDIPEVKVKIWNENPQPELAIICFTITNSLGLHVDQESLKIELENKILMLKSKSYSHLIATERNSGLLKIHKSVRDLNAIGFDTEATLNFGIESNQFYISISVPFRIFVYESHDQSKNSLL